MGRAIIWNGASSLRFCSLATLCLVLLACDRPLHDHIENNSAAAEVVSSAADRVVAIRKSPDCFSLAERRSVPSDVGADIARGETRLYFALADEDADYRPVGVSNCEHALRTVTRVDPDLFGPGPGNNAKENACRVALGNYMADYNRELFRQHPQVAQSQCGVRQLKFESYRRLSPEIYLKKK
jgi:hypothetical protein